MSETSIKIKTIEEQIEKGLWDLEIKEKLDQAFIVYKQAEAELLALDMSPDNSEYAEQQRVLAYCLMRQGNMLRQMGRPKEASALGEREITAARASGDEITLARSLMSNGTNLIVRGELTPGLERLDEARQHFEHGDSPDHRQGVGWYWILQVDLANAGMIAKGPAEVVEIATRALDILLPIENWPGVARLYAARAKAHEKLGEEEEARKDREQQAIYEGKV